MSPDELHARQRAAGLPDGSTVHDMGLPRWVCVFIRASWIESADFDRFSCRRWLLTREQYGIKVLVRAVTLPALVASWHEYAGIFEQVMQ